MAALYHGTLILIGWHIHDEEISFHASLHKMEDFYFIK